MISKGSSSPQHEEKSKKNRRVWRGVGQVLLLIALSAFLAGLLQIWGRQRARPAPIISGAEIKIVTQNIGDVSRPRPNANEVLAEFRKMPEAAVYLLQEVRMRRLIEGIVEGLSTESRRFSYVSNPRSGIAIVSSLPILEWESGPNNFALNAVLQLDDNRQLRVVSVHLPAFWKARDGDGDALIGPLYAALRIARETVMPNGRSRAAREIVKWLKPEYESLPVIIGGDFNTTPWTLAPRKMHPYFTDSLGETGHYWSGTYTRIYGPISPRIDYLFHSEDIGLVDAFVHERTAGDHLPIYAEYVIP